jgi:ADP-heptose:LPS heptosyltransferase
LSKIAVLRANAVGDFIVALPALQALRDTWPDAEIVLLARAWHRAFLEGRPGPVDRVEVLPPIPALNHAAETDESARALLRQEAAARKAEAV